MKHTNTNGISCSTAPPHQLERLLSKVSTLIAGLIALSMAIACGAPEGSMEDSGDLASRNDALVHSDGTGAFKYFQPILQPPNGTGDPGFCTPDAAHSKIIFSRDTTGYVQGTSDIVGINGPWGKYGGSGSLRKLNSRPACGFLPGTSSPYSFIIVARGITAPNGTTDRHLFWSRGQWVTTSQSAPAPSAVTSWAAIDANATFSTNGLPAVATRHGNDLVVVYLTDGGQLRANTWNAGSSSFNATISAPNLPSGWTGVGTPAIAYAENTTPQYVIFLRAKNSSNMFRLYRTGFGTTSFGGGYTQITLPAGSQPIGSDVAYEWDNYGTWATLYYRDSLTLWQGTGTTPLTDFSGVTFRDVLNGAFAVNVTGNPLVIGGVPYEQGRHWVLVRGTDGILFGESFNDEDLDPN